MQDVREAARVQAARRADTDMVQSTTTRRALMEKHAESGAVIMPAHFPMPTPGNIIRDGLNNLFGSPWPIIAAGTAITLVVLAFNLVGDAVRDALDPTTADQ